MPKVFPPYSVMCPIFALPTLQCSHSALNHHLSFPSLSLFFPIQGIERKGGAGEANRQTEMGISIVCCLRQPDLVLEMDRPCDSVLDFFLFRNFHFCLGQHVLWHLDHKQDPFGDNFAIPPVCNHLKSNSMITGCSQAIFTLRHC